MKIDLKNFWYDHEYYTKNYVEAPLTDEMITLTEKKLGYKLPQSYISLMKTQNGGAPKKNYWWKEDAKSDEVNVIGLGAFFGIGKEKKYSIFGERGNEFWFTEWEYPREIGMIIADTETGGHHMIYLDYRECGKEGEPKVSVCFQESDYKTQVLAENFEEFLSMLVSEEEIEWAD